MSTRHWILSGLLLLHFALAIAFSVMVPLAEAPDEADHWAYIIYLAEERNLPVGAAIAQSKHPPIYHISAAVIASLASPSNDFLQPNPDVDLAPAPGWTPNFFTHSEAEAWPWHGGVLSFHLVRFWSALLSTLTIVATYGLVRSALPGNIPLALAAAGVLAFIPEFAFIGGAITNDNAAALFGTLALWGGFALYQGRGRLQPGWWTPLALGAGLLSKTSTVGVWPAIGLAIILGAARTTDPEPTGVKAWSKSVMFSWRRWLISCTVVFGLGLLVAAPWFLRNWQLYGDPLGLSMALRTIDLRNTPWSWGDTRWLLTGWFVSFWGKFGGAGHIPMPTWIYGLLGLASLASLTGLAINLLPSKRRFPLTPLALLLIAILGVAAVMWRYSLIALGTDQGRLLYPAVGAIVTLFVVGLINCWPRQFEKQVAIALVGSMFVLGIYILMGVIRPTFADAGMSSQGIIEAAKNEDLAQPIPYLPKSRDAYEIASTITLR